VSDRFVIGVPLGRWQTNCFVIGDREQGTAVVVDPGEHGEQQVPDVLEQAGVRCEAILLTHGHLDHIWGVPDLARGSTCRCCCIPDDRWLWDDPPPRSARPPSVLQRAARPARVGPADRAPRGRPRRPAPEASLGITFDVHHNPGHTPGHVTYLGRDLAGPR
jgi:hydroxyacylglutathione hydrolase